MSLRCQTWHILHHDDGQCTTLAKRRTTRATDGGWPASGGRTSSYEGAGLIINPLSGVGLMASQADVTKHSPLLAGVRAALTSNGLDVVVDEIVSVLKS